MGTIPDADIYKSSLDHARQLSTLRFAILTVFMTVSGALFVAYFSQNIPYPLISVAVAGLWLAVVFLGCEIALSFTMARQNSVAKEMLGEARQNIFRHR